MPLFTLNEVRETAALATDAYSCAFWAERSERLHTDRLSKWRGGPKLGVASKYFEVLTTLLGSGRLNHPWLS